MRNQKYNEDKDISELMALAYPELMEKSNDSEFYIENGWIDIIDTLFSVICADYKQAYYQWDGAIKYPRGDNDYENECFARMQNEKEKLPKIVLIKEKYGTMRVYVDGGNEKIHAAIMFAETISSVTCEKCGNKGFLSGDWWQKTYCEKHHIEAGNDIDE